MCSAPPTPRKIHCSDIHGQCLQIVEKYSGMGIVGPGRTKRTGAQGRRIIVNWEERRIMLN